jgi:hypothetical protein
MIVMKKSINHFWKRVYLIPVLVGGLALSGFAQYPNTQRQQDENTCRQKASEVGKHKGLKDAGIGAAGGAAAGKIIGKPGAGAVVGGAAGGVYGHKKSNNENWANEKSAKKYNKCMRDKGYSM